MSVAINFGRVPIYNEELPYIKSPNHYHKAYGY